MVRLDTELALGTPAPPIKTGSQSRKEQLAIQGAEQDIDLNRQTIAANEQKLRQNQAVQNEAQRKQQGVAKLSELLSTYSKQDEQGGRKVDHNAIMQGLAASGFGDTALAYDTTRRADEASTISNEMNELKNAREKGKEFASIVNAAILKRTPEAAERAIGSLIAGGFVKGPEAAQLLSMPKDEQFWMLAEQKRDEHVDYDKQIESYYKKREEDHKTVLRPLEVENKKLANTEKTQETTGTKPIQPAEQARLDQSKVEMEQRASEGALNRGVQVRGQNMTDARGRDLADATRDAKPPTGAERRVFSFYERAKDASDVLQKLEGDMADKGLMAQGVFKFAPNFLQSEDNQVYRQAQRQFTEARLRKDSGAAIAKSEYENDENMYFPVPGDTKKNLQRKADARAKILSSLARESGKAGKEAGVDAGASPSGPKVGDVVSVGGKQVKIKALHGDGSFDGDEVK